MSDVNLTIKTPEAILSYPHLFVPRAGPDGGEAKYSAVFIFPEGTDLTEIKQAILAAAEKKWPGKSASMWKAGRLRNPLRTDWEEKGYPENSIFLSARSKSAPGIVSRYAGPDGKPLPITDAGEMYPGAIVRASLRAYAYDVAGNRGVSFNLGNLQKLRDGDRLDGRANAEDEFEALDDAPADFDGGQEDNAGVAPADALDSLLGV